MSTQEDTFPSQMISAFTPYWPGLHRLQDISQEASNVGASVSGAAVVGASVLGGKVGCPGSTGLRLGSGVGLNEGAGVGKSV